MVTEAQDWTGVQTYERELTDEQLMGLAGDLQRRAAMMMQQGIAVPMQQLQEHHFIGLLETLVGPDEALRIREWQLTWTDRYFDQLEATERMKVLVDDDLPGFP